MIIGKIFSLSQFSKLLTITTIPLLIVTLNCQSTVCLNEELPPGWFEEKYTHVLKDLSSEEHKTLALMGSKLSFETLLDPILIPRVPGTENSTRVKKYLIGHMKSLDWTVETDAFIDNTPQGEKPFENIIATLNPDTPRRSFVTQNYNFYVEPGKVNIGLEILVSKYKMESKKYLEKLVIACHFDSKYAADYEFIGAVDSAVPCAQMLHLAYTMKTLLNAHKNSPQNVTLQYIFFDGEEAFRSWTQTDSLYGSRHLAAEWESIPYPPKNPDGTNELNRIDVFMLLDLIGAAVPKFSSFFEETSRLHGALVEAEQNLKRSRYLTGPPAPPMFLAKSAGGRIEDDHIPFLQRNVPILHVIALPFPSVWHSASDTKDALDFHSIENLNRIFRVFVARYLHLDIVE